MHILVAVDKYQTRAGGADRSLRSVVEALTTAGHRLTVLTAADEQPGPDAHGATVIPKPLPKPRLFRDGDWTTLRWNPQWLPIVAETLRNDPAGLLITQNMLSPASIAAAKALNVPSATFIRGYRCIAPHFFIDQNALTAPRPSFWNVPLRHKLKWPLIRKCMELYAAGNKGVNILIANSQYVADLMQQYYDRPAHVFLPVLNMEIPPAPVHPDPTRPVLFAKPQSVKGVERVIELARRRPQRRFRVVGASDGHFRAQLERLPNVEVHGWVDDMDAMYRDASLLLAPSRYPEPFGRVFVEAGLHGVPGLGNQTGGIPEAIGDGGRVLLYADGIEAWCAALDTLLEPTEHAAASQRARAHALALLQTHTRKRLLRILNLPAS